MMKKFSFALPLLLIAMLTACSSSEANKAEQTNPPAPGPQEVKAQSAGATNANVVKADGAVAQIPSTPATTTPTAPIDPNAPAPKLFIAAKKVDLGTVKEEATLNRTIALKNTGQAELQIEAVTPSCGCTAVDFPKSIAPGKSGTIKYKVETGKGTGLKTKTISIKTNDPNEPTVTYEFSFTVK